MWRNAATDPRGSDTQAGVQTYDDLYADTRKWVREGWIDYVVPQLYWNIGFPAADYAEARSPGGRRWPRAPDAAVRGRGALQGGRPGQPAAWQDPAELSRHLTLAARYPQVRGHVFFSAKDVAADPLGAMARVVADHYTLPAHGPALTPSGTGAAALVSRCRTSVSGPGEHTASCPSSNRTR